MAPRPQIYKHLDNNPKMTKNRNACRLIHAVMFPGSPARAMSHPSTAYRCSDPNHPSFNSPGWALFRCGDNVCCGALAASGLYGSAQTGQFLFFPFKHNSTVVVICCVYYHDNSAQKMNSKFEVITSNRGSENKNYGP